ncbi:MAG: T9SS type A sorting domain-containing protein, partial [Bacteroidota bacterium]|nr:T9SS type A sorting domain-containing protein [Bacteroidota bacterium]
SGQDLSVTAKKCNVELLSVSAANTGDIFTIDAADAGLLYLRKETYFNMVGSPFDKVKVPTNCCDNPMGRVFFPFEVIGWTDTYGNSCDDSNHSMQFQSNDSEKDHSVEDGDGSMLSQYPNPADNYSTFEFLLPKAQKADVSIWNIRGQLVETIFSGVVEASTVNRVEYDLSELQSGIYFVHLTTSSGVLKKKFVILK